ncbi:MAG TPA: hypothetical protein DDZ83_17730 [Nitrospinae bacterium]|nr:hypothetical protein [Nitrospinota bacterium]
MAGFCRGHKTVPERTCIACRRKGPPETLFRMVAGPDGEVYAELDSRLPGRGAYCCFRGECLNSALEPRNLNRALRGKVNPPDSADIAAAVQSLLGRRIEGLLGAAWRKKAVAAGRDAAMRALRSSRAGRIFLAEDLSRGSRAGVMEGLARPPVEMKMEMGRIGDILGGRPVGVFFVSDPLLADSLELRSSQASALALL